MTLLTWMLAAVPLLSIVTLTVYAWTVERRDRRAKVVSQLELVEAMHRHPSWAGVRVVKELQARAVGGCVQCEMAGPVEHDDDLAAGRTVLRWATEIGDADG